ncbi:exodeoxyribonuclease V alpha subunit [Caldalkalibacillus uzonensis]|uniref:ATP-dependent RecD2 DNA helicase n=1 Tax=Caldalkalibacillus uzonensis TaxID=353224 RepID=A0ABU0CTW6_9BACI|nr:ATP-dependent RecD-like DNA helicase [Caldalkalibacillus uzonensis]MDQ0339543.1 exodeoxyribonuclease V alpha subunit [Caldalkalibacillus uzonensis]
MNVIQPSLFDESRPYIKGRLVYEIFHNTDNLYTVSKVKIVETTEEIDEKHIIVVGHYPSLLEGEVYTFWGQMKDHPRFGLQYHIDYFRKELPQGREGLIQYLSSDLFPGVGEKTAARIVDTLGEKAINVILENPDVLREVPRLNEELRQTVYRRLLEYQGLEQIMVKLGEFGIGLSLSIQIYQTYAERAMQVLEENPYQLIEDIDGIGFKRADAIARAMGVKEDAPERIRAACHYFLCEQAEQNGHVYYPLDLFIPGVQKWLNQQGEMDNTGQLQLEHDRIEQQVLEMAEEGKLILEDDRLYLPSLFFAEKGFAKKVKQLVKREVELPVSHDQFLHALGELEERLGIQYAESQKQAIEQALHSSLMILTGGPGTGKTTVIKGIVELYAQLYHLSLDPKEYARKEESFPFLLVAPTGRAAKRMEESTGLPAFTIHRLLGWKGGQEFDYSEENPLKGKLLIVDETSMMDQWLANQLFRALPDDIQVILVGDQDQLPSVGPGQVLSDLLESKQIPVVELKDVFRQAQDSSIITLAHQIKRGKVEEDITHPKPDRRFFACTVDQVVHVVCQVCQSALNKGYTPKEIQVLAPMYRGAAGIDALNEALQKTFNPPAENKRELKVKDHVFRVGDKVLQLVNNLEQHVFNGDIGEVTAILPAKETREQEDRLVVAFDHKEVSYKKSELHQLTLAYCCSIHKSQGSEYPIVVIPVVRAYQRMLRRNLLYTAITRGRDYLIFCGEKSTFIDAIAREEVSTRYTYLKETLREWLTGNHS